MKRIRSLDIFDDSFNSDTGEPKPVMIAIVDVGQDKNARYTRNYSMCDQLFHHPGLAYALSCKERPRKKCI